MSSSIYEWIDFIRSINGTSLQLHVQALAVICGSSEFLLYVCRISAIPGLDDRDMKNAAEEKKRAYQLELQRQVFLLHF